MPGPPRPLEPDPVQLESHTRAVTELVLDQLRTLGRQPSFDLDGVKELRASFREPVPEEGHSIEALLARLRPAIAKSYNTAGPGYLAYIPGGGVYAAALADLLAAATNRYVGVTGAAPVLAQIEQTAVSWLCTLMGLPAGSRGILTSGGSLSSFSAIATARHERLGEHFADGSMYFSDQTHHCVTKSARLAGLPRASLRELPADARFRLVPRTLEEAVREDRARGRRPFLVVA